MKNEEEMPWYSVLGWIVGLGVFLFFTVQLSGKVLDFKCKKFGCFDGLYKSPVYDHASFEVTFRDYPAKKEKCRSMDIKLVDLNRRPLAETHTNCTDRQKQGLFLSQNYAVVSMKDEMTSKYFVYSFKNGASMELAQKDLDSSERETLEKAYEVDQ